MDHIGFALAALSFITNLYIFWRMEEGDQKFKLLKNEIDWHQKAYKAHLDVEQKKDYDISTQFLNQNKAHKSVADILEDLDKELDLFRKQISLLEKRTRIVVHRHFYYKRAGQGKSAPIPGAAGGLK